MIRTHPLVASVVLVALTLFVFWRVGLGYARYGRFTPTTLGLQMVLFFVHGLSCYSFLGFGRPLAVSGSVLYTVSVGLMVIGLVLVVGAMAQLSFAGTFGGSAGGLRSSGFYRVSRNPQLVAYVVILLGCALQMPAVGALIWLALYAFIAYVMVRTEETHLRNVLGTDYEEYCKRTPRYLGLPGRQRGPG